MNEQDILGIDAVALLNQLRNHEREPASLATGERRAIVAVLSGPSCKRLMGKPKLTQLELAEMLDVAQSNISNDLKVIRGWRGQAVTEEHLNEILGSLSMSKAMAQDYALADGDYALFWRVEREFADKLEDLGIVARQPIELAGTLDHRHAFSNFSPDQARELLEFARDSVPMGDDDDGDGDADGEGESGDG